MKTSFSICALTLSLVFAAATVPDADLKTLVEWVLSQK